MALSALAVAGVSLVALDIALGNRKILTLKKQNILPEDKLPFLSVVVAARNEERGIEKALRSLLSLRYPRYEVIVVNDRSEDGTGSILERMQKTHANLQVVNLHTLPVGWLGKNHALHKGAAKARGDYVLFTDADIVFEPESLSRAMSYVVSEKLDHLAVIPELEIKGLLMPMMMSYFTYCFAANFRPWKMRDPNSSKAIGIGAFNLVSRRMYLELGGHEKIKLRPDDDLMLGKWLKLNHARQDVLFGLDDVKVEWYRTFSELFFGLEKNVYAGAEYQFWKMLLMNVFVILLHVLPFVSVFFAADPYMKTMSVLWALILVISSYDNSKFHRFASWTVLLFPLAAVLMLVIMNHAVMKTILLQGIRWRGTFYSLEELKKNKLL